MRGSLKVEAEKNELVLKNSHGDFVIIPAEKRDWVKNKLSEKKYSEVDKFVKNLPVASQYAEDGTVISEEEPILVPPKGYYKTTPKDNANVNNKIIDNKKSIQINPKEQAVLRADTRTEQERNIARKYADAVFNPSIGQQITEGVQLGLRYAANPLKGVGDFVNTYAPNSNIAKDLPTTNEDRFEYRKKQLSPYSSPKEKLKNLVDESRDLTINSLINAGTLEAGFAMPRSLTNSTMTNIFKEGSKANFAADLLQLTKTDLDKLSKGDMDEIADAILNSASLLSKMDNFDASTVYGNIKNWKNLSKSDKVDTVKDIFNLSQIIAQQGQRNEK